MHNTLIRYRKFIIINAKKKYNIEIEIEIESVEISEKKIIYCI